MKKKPLPEISPRAAIKIFDLQAWEVSQASSGQASEKNPDRRYKKPLFAGMGS
jgi:hypothetical protein